MTTIIAMMCAVAMAACSQSHTSTTSAVPPTVAAPSDAAIEAPTADGRVIFDTVCDNNPLAKGC